MFHPNRHWALAGLLTLVAIAPLRAYGPCDDFEFASEERSDDSVEARITNFSFDSEGQEVYVSVHIDRQGGDPSPGEGFPVRGQLAFEIQTLSGASHDVCIPLEDLNGSPGLVGDEYDFTVSAGGELPRGRYFVTAEVGLTGDRPDDPAGNLSHSSAWYGPHLEFLGSWWSDEGLVLSLRNFGSMETGALTVEAHHHLPAPEGFQGVVSHTLEGIGSMEDAAVTVPLPRRGVYSFLEVTGAEEGASLTRFMIVGPGTGREEAEALVEEIGVEEEQPLDYFVRSVSVSTEGSGFQRVVVEVDSRGEGENPSYLKMVARHDDAGRIQENLRTVTIESDMPPIEWLVQIPTPFTLTTSIHSIEDSGSPDENPDNDEQVVEVEEDQEETTIETVTETGTGSGSGGTGSGGTSSSESSGTGGATIEDGGGTITYGTTTPGEPIPLTLQIGARLGGTPVVYIKWQLTSGSIQTLASLGITPSEGLDPEKQRTWHRGDAEPTMLWYGDPSGSWISEAVAGTLEVDIEATGTLVYDTLESGNYVENRTDFVLPIHLEDTGQLPGPDLVVVIARKIGDEIKPFHPEKRDKNRLRMDQELAVLLYNQGLARFPQRIVRGVVGWREKPSEGNDSGSFGAFEFTTDGIEPGESLAMLIDPMTLDCGDERIDNKRGNLTASFEVVTFDGEISNPETDTENNTTVSPPVYMNAYQLHCAGGNTALYGGSEWPGGQN